MPDALLDVRGLQVDIARSRRAPVRVVDGVSFAVAAGEAVGIVGESGSGKTMTALAIVHLLPPGGRISGGSVAFAGRNVTSLDERAMREIRGAQISMIFQDPMVALDPLFTIGDQMLEAMRAHTNEPAHVLRSRAVELLAAVGLSTPEIRLRQYPHELSGGMLQRVIGAIAVACGARLVLADEPTTALDPTMQAQFLDLLDELRRTRALSVVLVTHDFGAAARLCRRILVMYAGQIVENGTTAQLFERPAHPYTRGLLEAVRIDDRPRARLTVIEGQPPDPADVGPGCRFAERCAYADARCRAESPPIVALEGGHEARCWKAGTL
jgi:oligopeptide/dipeptide ABC transporter ATP-binding protein